MEKLWLLVLTYAVLGLVAHQVYMGHKTRKIAREKRSHGRLAKLLPKPMITDTTNDSDMTDYRFKAEGCGRRAYGATADAARANWLKEIWKELVD